MNKAGSKTTFDDIKQIKTLDHLSYVLGIKKRVLLGVAENINRHYSPFVDRKGKKPRKIDNPSKFLKEIHKKIKDRILTVYPIFYGSFGGVPGKTIRDNAKKHLRKRIVIRLDLKDCFHSISADKVYETYSKKFNFPKKMATLLTQLTTYKKHIPVGSPLSSTLVNITLDDMWRKIDELSRPSGHESTDWIDDIVVSGNNAEKLIKPIKEVINKNRLKIGWHKLEIMRSNKPQVVTGTTVNYMLGIPKEKRKKYANEITSTHKHSGEPSRIIGQLAHTRFINPNQANQLSKLLRKNHITCTKVDTNPQ